MFCNTNTKMNWLFVLNIFFHVFFLCLILYFSLPFVFTFLILAGYSVILGSAYYFRTKKTSKTKVILFTMLNYFSIMFYFFCFELVFFKNYCLFEKYKYLFCSITTVVGVLTIALWLYFYEIKIFLQIFWCFKSYCAFFITIFLKCFLLIILFCFTIFSSFLFFQKLKYKINLISIFNVFLISIVCIILLFNVLNIIIDKFSQNKKILNQQLCVNENEMINRSVNIFFNKIFLTFL